MKAALALLALLLVALILYACVIDAHHTARIAVSREPTATPTVTPTP